MRHRVCKLLEKMVGYAIDGRDLWISTFHSACVRILRSEIHHLGLNSSFTILVTGASPLNGKDESDYTDLN